jgi:hypothetical protein
MRDYLDILTGRGQGSGWIELRYRYRDGMRTRFYPAAGSRQMIARTIARHAARRDVYVGCALRSSQRGNRKHVGEAWALWVECDGCEAGGVLAAFEPAPSLTIASGTPGHLHAYWALQEPLNADAVEQGNRRLARAVGGDPACFDAARILRPPDTLNHKHVPPRPVYQVGALLPEPYTVANVLSGLPPIPARPVPELPRVDSSDPLLVIPPAAYVPKLTGLTVSPNNKVCCPFHDDRTPSLHIYDSPERGWFCFGCCRGGSIYDLAAELWSIDPRGSGFLELRRRLSDRFGSDYWSRSSTA